MQNASLWLNILPMHTTAIKHVEVGDTETHSHARTHGNEQNNIYVIYCIHNLFT